MAEVFEAKGDVEVVVAAVVVGLNDVGDGDAVVVVGLEAGSRPVVDRSFVYLIVPSCEVEFRIYLRIVDACSRSFHSTSVLHVVMPALEEAELELARLCR